MNPSKRIQPHVGAKAAERKAPTNKIGGGMVSMVKSHAIKAAKHSVSKAHFNHTAKAHSTPDLKNARNK